MQSHDHQQNIDLQIKTLPRDTGLSKYLPFSNGNMYKFLNVDIIKGNYSLLFCFLWKLMFEIFIRVMVGIVSLYIFFHKVSAHTFKISLSRHFFKQ